MAGRQWSSSVSLYLTSGNLSSSLSTVALESVVDLFGFPQSVEFRWDRRISARVPWDFPEWRSGVGDRAFGRAAFHKFDRDILLEHMMDATPETLSYAWAGLTFFTDLIWLCICMASHRL